MPPFHVQPMPEDGKFDSRPDQAALKAAIADFLKHLEVQEKLGYRDLDTVLSRLQVQRKVDQTGVSSQLWCRGVMQARCYPFNMPSFTT